MDGFVVVHKTSGLPEAEIIRGYLESYEIPVDLAYESIGPAYGITVDGLGEVRLRVPEECEDRARELLRQRSEDDSRPDESV